jgi:hypothetical protein
MRWLIRKVARKGKGQVSYEEDVHYGDELTIGRGADQAIFLTDLRAALQHARVTALGGGRYRVDSLITAGIRINGGIAQSGALGAGGVIEIGATRIELQTPPEDFDAAIEVSSIEKAELAAAEEKRAKPTSLGQTWLARRWPAWILFFATLLLFLGLPMLSHYYNPAAGMLDATPLPSRTAWEAGDLADAHHFFGNDCETCHTRGFKWVRDEACLACHGGIAAHADPVVFNLPQLGEARCAHCHRDHNGRDGLVRNDQALCADCHADLAGKSGGASRLASVTDFGIEHPEFKVALPVWDAQGRFAPQRVELKPDLQEKSGLKFPHDVHLDPDGLSAPDGRQVLTCASCHVPDAGGTKMQPVDFESMCQSCHKLTFDVTEPEREVPHAKIQEIIYTLDEFYARRALEGIIKDPTAPPNLRARRRPGQPVTPEIRQEALSYARDKSRTVGESLFTGRACSVCHAVSPGRRAEEPWIVAPVRVAGVWFPKSQFDHGSHTTMTCVGCHPAERSSSSASLLLPDIASCRMCHAGEAGARDRLQSGCTSCHGYHESAHLMQAEL